MFNQTEAIMKITLEKWKYEDYIDFYNASNDIRIYENMSDNFPKTLEECQKTVIAIQQISKTHHTS